MKIRNLILIPGAFLVLLPVKAFMSPDPVTESVVFVSRQPLKGEDGCAVPGLGPKYRTAKVGGRLMLGTADGAVRPLVEEDRMFDVADPCVTWDGQYVLFSGVAHPDSAWRIYRVSIDGTHLTQLTSSDRTLDLSQFGESARLFESYDDLDPCQLPDGRIVFSSTRYPSLASYGQIPTTNLWVMGADGSNLHRLTTERNGADEPTVDPLTGRVVYARWWVNIDRPSNVTKHGITRNDQEALTDDVANVWQAVTIKPDGSDLKLYAGFPRTRPGLQAYKPFVMSDGSLLCTFVPDLSMSVSMDAVGVRRFRQGADWEKEVAGVWSDRSPVAPPFATDAVEFANGKVLLAYSSDGRDFDIYSCSVDGKEMKKIAGLHGTMELEPQVVRPRPVPPILPDHLEAPRKQLPPTEDPGTYEWNGTFRFDCMNIFLNGDVDQPIPDAPKITRDARIRIFLNSQRRSADRLDAAILLKEAPVFPNGGIHFSDSPADVPLFEQIVDSKGRVLETSSGKLAHVSGYNFERMGAGTKCAGCHVGHSLLTVPINSAVAEWFNAAPSASVTASSSWSSCMPSRVVDRQARTGGDTVQWVSAAKGPAWVQLNWSMPIEIRELVLYNITPDAELGTSVVVEACDVEFLLAGQKTREVTVKEKLKTDGTRVSVPPTRADAVRVTVRKSKGKFRTMAVTGLAEVEAIARLVSDLN